MTGQIPEAVHWAREQIGGEQVFPVPEGGWFIPTFRTDRPDKPELPRTPSRSGSNEDEIRFFYDW